MAGASELTVISFQNLFSVTWRLPMAFTRVGPELLFAAVHESLPGPSLQSPAMQQSSRFRDEEDIQRAAFTETGFYEYALAKAGFD
jgi:hypothetical protein